MAPRTDHDASRTLVGFGRLASLLVPAASAVDQNSGFALELGLGPRVPGLAVTPHLTQRFSRTAPEVSRADEMADCCPGTRLRVYSQAVETAGDLKNFI